MDKIVVMGRVVAPYGIYGWLKVEPFTEHVDGLLDYPVWQVGREDDHRKVPWQPMEVEAAKLQNQALLVKLAGVNDRDTAFKCKGLHVAISRDELPEAAEGEYYWSDLIGLVVVNVDGQTYGAVTGLMETGANDVLVVGDKKRGERERLIPYIPQVVLQVDMSAKQIRVDWDADF